VLTARLLTLKCEWVDTTRDSANRVNTGFAKSLRLVSHDCIAYPMGGNFPLTLSKKNMYTLQQLQQKNLAELKEIGRQLNVLPASDRRCRQNWIDAIVGVNPPLLQLLEVSPAASAVEQVQPIIETLETPSAVEVEPVQMLPIESKFGRIVYSQPAQKPIVQSVENFPGVDPGVDVDRALEPIAQVAKNSPGVEVDSVEESIVPAKNFPGSRSKASIAHQLLELFQSTAHIIEDSPGVKTEATLSESAIAPAVKNPILTGLTFSDRFLARYAPPQVQIIHFQSDADGQLSLLDFEVQSVDEPPDPDDFESLELFRDALALWDWEHNEVSPEHNEPLQVSLDSFSLWGFCPVDWYESAALLEPPDTGIFAKLPKSNPPSFLPATVGQVRAKRSSNAAQTQSKRISNAYQTHTCCILACSSTQLSRSPPGGDAGF